MPHQLPLLAKQRPKDTTHRDDTDRVAAIERLRARLSDPTFRAIEGFPIGEDEAILALSDPPYYTACPNPFLPEIVARWQEERRDIRAGLGLPDDAANGYSREPFAADVSEGKNDPIYNAHSYHTKVPHKAIMRYILHYTDPGDVVFDGFCGTGMTGVAAQLCGDKRAVESLGYRVDADGVIYDGQTPISRLGARKAVLVDLSPAATFIAYNYNTPVDVAAFEAEAKRILAEVEAECGWMYETWHPHCDHPQRVKARINYTVWSEVFACPNCTGEITFLDEALDAETQRVRDQFPCPHCGALLGKRSLERVRVATFDPLLNRPADTLKRRPVSIEYTVGRSKHSKPVDDEDLRLLERIEQAPPAQGIPVVPLPIARMYHGSRLAPKGVEHVHQLFLPRPSHALALLWQKAEAAADARLRAFLLFTVEQAIWGMSLLSRYVPTHYSQVNQYLAGVYYISSLISEVSPWYILDGKSERIVRAFAGLHVAPGRVAIATQSAAAPPVDNTIDYIFTDPPFGENIYYADLNFLVESWHGVRTDSGPEAIVDQAKRKTLRDYGELMRRAFAAYYRWLKPGRWMTVEFHNSHNAVWNAIQEALMAAGFVVADVRTLDKQQRSYRQVTANTATKQDLVISAYKPTAAFEQRFHSQAGSESGAWAFADEHLRHLPLPQLVNGRLEVLAERQAYLLFDRMVAFHIQRGLTVPLGAAEFYAGLRQRYSERDGMYFLPLQASQYDRLRLEAAEVEQLPLIVADERSAILWLRRELGEQPLTYQDLQPSFLRELHQAGHEQLPELRAILEESFLQDEAGRWYVPDPGRAQDLERLRERALLREFRTYVEGRGRLKLFRSEAVRAGFGDAWRRRDYAVIVAVAQRLPERVVQEDADLLMYYDNALMRMETA
jgi:predicted RNA methylase